ncbi:aldose epimerase family protein [Gilvimarinus sp. SDUM040013]|uniref:Aldose 1-epimerase n=1 Tax=Gilvimarinus gilvus TaxID=3058038 RepID=A0ABU4RVN3_9GAMM|nr:aldose epimerase family protein [Gilvimarinus sp. SDUM040013]MDO3387246.1 aldose epimerase family protein [Gilvimarinus sp. SDUM040013]MDX6848935.1 aldose epimerase family protein [Gilvimarinus sp. SDUM040013]
MFDIKSAPFGILPDGREAQLFTLTNPAGMRVCISNYGGIITECWVPDNKGQLADVVLGFDNLDDYVKDSPYFGALIGRVGNRLNSGQFTLRGETYSLAKNENDISHLHGGVVGFDKVVWQTETRVTNDAAELHLRYISADGEEGYPGELTVDVVYRLSADNALVTEYKATTTAPTPVNLTQHSYFNLAGSGSVENHTLCIHAEHFTPVNDELIPTGEIEPVAGSAFDFTAAKAIGCDVASDHPQLNIAGGYDHNFVLKKTHKSDFVLAAEAIEPASGRILKVYTTEPGVQFYSGNFLDGSIRGKGLTYHKHAGFCLEPQHFPDAPNQKDFDDITLQPGETYTSTMSFQFSAL